MDYPNAPDACTVPAPPAEWITGGNKTPAPIKMKWIDALKQWNGKRGGSWCIPRKDTPEYNEVRAIMSGEQVMLAEEKKNGFYIDTVFNNILKKPELTSKYFIDGKEYKPKGVWEQGTSYIKMRDINFVGPYEGFVERTKDQEGDLSSADNLMYIGTSYESGEYKIDYYRSVSRVRGMDFNKVNKPLEKKLRKIPVHISDSAKQLIKSDK